MGDYDGWTVEEEIRNALQDILHELKRIANSLDSEDEDDDGYVPDLSDRPEPTPSIRPW